MPITRRHLMAGAIAAFTAVTSLRGESDPVPAFHTHLPKGALPETKDPGQYADKPVVKRVYELAGKIRPVLYQLPCYCSCDKFAGHGSLLDCFVDSHGEECSICQHEAVYAYEQAKAGRSAKQIRAGVIAGEWRKVDMGPSALAAL